MPLPARLAVTVPPGVPVTLSVAASMPPPVGAKMTVTVHWPPPSSTAPWHVVPVIWNCVVPTPLMNTLRAPLALPPLFVTVRVCGALCWPTSMFPNEFAWLICS